MFRKIHNTEQNAANTLKLYESESGCCTDGALEQCQYDVTIPTANAVNSITIKDATGANKTLTFSPAVTGAVDVKAAIKAAIEAEGYEDDTDVVASVSSAAVSTNTIYSITGEVVVVSMVHNGATSVNATAKCDRVSNCTFAVDAYPGGAANAMTISGTDYALGAITPGTTTGPQVKTAVEGALTSAGVTGAVTVTTNGSGGSTTYNISIVALSTSAFDINDEQLVRSDCQAAYIA